MRKFAVDLHLIVGRLVPEALIKFIELAWIEARNFSELYRWRHEARFFLFFFVGRLWNEFSRSGEYIKGFVKESFTFVAERSIAVWLQIFGGKWEDCNVLATVAALLALVQGKCVPSELGAGEVALLRSQQASRYRLTNCNASANFSFTPMFVYRIHIMGLCVFSWIGMALSGLEGAVMASLPLRKESRRKY